MNRCGLRRRCPRQHFRRQVQTGYGIAAPCQFNGVASRSASDVKNYAAGRNPQFLQKKAHLPDRVLRKDVLVVDRRMRVKERFPCGLLRHCILHRSVEPLVFSGVAPLRPLEHLAGPMTKSPARRSGSVTYENLNGFPQRFSARYSSAAGVLTCSILPVFCCNQFQGSFPIQRYPAVGPERPTSKCRLSSEITAFKSHPTSFPAASIASSFAFPASMCFS